MRQNMEKLPFEYMEDMLVRMAHHSTAIEGNTLTQAETISILIHNFIPRDMSEREYYEVKNYRKAFNTLLEADRKITTELIKKYNKDIMENLHDLNGKFKTTQNLILGAEFEPTKPYLVLFEIEDCCNNLSYNGHAQKTRQQHESAVTHHADRAHRTVDVRHHRTALGLGLFQAT